MHDAVELNPVSVAWLAGIIEGEGCITRVRARSGILRVVMTDEDVIRKLASVSGVGTVVGPYASKNPKAKPVWVWTVMRVKDLRPLLVAISPHLGRRRSERVAEVLAHIASSRGARADLSCCPKGHPYEQRYAGRAARFCKTCRNASERRRYAAARQEAPQ